LDDPLSEHYEAAGALISMGSAALPAGPALRRFVAKTVQAASPDAAAKEYAQIALKNLAAK
jgi:F0F1-type ATP synthase membrane subunit c/vacuolar-type H+-ATPase subunit K